MENEYFWMLDEWKAQRLIDTFEIWGAGKFSKTLWLRNHQ